MFAPPAGQSFGSLDDLLPGSPFSLVPTGFGSNGTTVADTGTVMLTTYVGSLTNATTNRIATFTAAGQTASATVGYDGNGNIASDGVNAYLYDAEGNRIGNGSIATWSCDITVNGYRTQSDYILDQGGRQETEVPSRFES